MDGISRLHVVYRSLSERVSEYTQPKPGATDHSVRTDETSSVIEANGQTANIAGSVRVWICTSPHKARVE